ncbi:hypothetical protein BgiBS90_031725 [Biomphalaria glabrata]|nr:hypothetical protein BgiBS90_031725 [Biomphalaria glabrata]
MPRWCFSNLLQTHFFVYSLLLKITGRKESVHQQRNCNHGITQRSSKYLLKSIDQPKCTSVNIDALKALPGTAPIFEVMSSPIHFY